jgi:xanthine dehydrogenase accessory factor
VNSVLEPIGDWARRGNRVAIATVVATRKSAPQPVGTKMALNDRGELIGAVSGGCVEGAVVEVAEGVLAAPSATAAPAARLIDASGRINEAALA